MYKIWIKNCVSKHKNLFHCHLCKSPLKNKDDVTNHIECNVQHKGLYDALDFKIFISDCEKLSEDKCLELINNSIYILHNSMYQCNLCNRNINGIKNVWEHIHGSRHKSTKLKNSVESSEENSTVLGTQYLLYCAVCDIKTETKKNMVEHLAGKRHKYKHTLKVTHDSQVQSKIKNKSHLQNHLSNNDINKTACLQNFHDENVNMDSSKSVSKLLTEPVKCLNLQSKSKQENKRNLVDSPKNLSTYFYAYHEACNIEVNSKIFWNDHMAARKSKFRSLQNHMSSNINKTTHPDEFCNKKMVSSTSVSNLSVECPINKTVLSKKSASLTSITQYSSFADEKLFEQNTVIRNEVSNSEHIPLKLNFVQNTELSSVNSIDKVLENKAKTVSLRRPKEDQTDTKFGSNKSIYVVDPLKLSRLRCFIESSCIFGEDIYCLICLVKVQYNVQIFYEHLCSKSHQEILIAMEESNKEFRDYPQQLSDLKLLNSFMRLIAENRIHCFVCNISIRSDNEDIHQHIRTVQHNMKSLKMKRLTNELCKEILDPLQNNWYNIEWYRCYICHLKSHYEPHFLFHLDSPEHKSKVQKLELKDIQMAFDSCISCSCLWFGKVNSYEQHMQSTNHKYFMQNKIYETREMPKAVKNMLSYFNMYMESLVRYSDNMFASEREENVLLKTLEDLIKTKFPNVKLYVFGLRVAKLGLPNTDIDIFLDVGITEISQDIVFSIQYLKEVEQCLKTNNTWEVKEISLTRMPVMKVFHCLAGVTCCLTFNNAIDVKKTEILRSFIDAWKPCRQMILFIKKWLSLCQIDNEDISSAIPWVVIFYLQIRGVFTSITTFINLKGNFKKHTDRNIELNKQILLKPLYSDIRSIMIDFFEYIYTFDYETQIICPFLGKPIEKKLFTMPNKIPQEMINWLGSNVVKDSGIILFESPMCIQDPIDLPQNITRGITKCTLRLFLYYCKESIKLLSNIQEDKF